MRIAIIGSQGVGKSTLFRVLTGLEEQRQKGFVSAVGTSSLPDPRLDALQEFTAATKKVPLQLEIHDFDGFGKMWKEREAGRVLQSLLGFDALVQVVADFSPFDGEDSFDEINLRLLLSDLDFVTRQLEKLMKEKAAGRVDPRLVSLFDKIKEPLLKEIPLYSSGLTGEEKKQLTGFGLLTLKPRVLVLNREEANLKVPLNQEFHKRLEETGFPKVETSLPLEEEMDSLEEGEREDFRKEMGLPPLKEKLFQALLGALDIIRFYTIVHGEVRAWLLRSGGKAIEAAGKIHTDMARGFIRAEVISVSDLLGAPSFKEAQKSGLTRIEGKDYVVQDGDILTIRFSPH